MNILLLLFYRFYVSFVFVVLLLLLCHVCYCDACKCLHGLGICVWFYPNKLMMMMMMWVVVLVLQWKIVVRQSVLSAIPEFTGIASPASDRNLSTLLSSETFLTCRLRTMPSKLPYTQCYWVLPIPMPNTSTGTR